MLYASDGNCKHIGESKTNAAKTYGKGYFMPRFQKIIITICLFIIVALTVIIVLMLNTTTQALKISGTFADISRTLSDTVSFDVLEHTEISIDAVITKNIVTVTGAEGTVKVGDTEYKITSASSDPSGMTLNSRSEEGILDLIVRTATGTNSAVVSVMPLENPEKEGTWVGPATDNASFNSVIKEQNIIRYTSMLKQEVNISGTFTDIYGDHVKPEEQYDNLEHVEVAIKATVEKNANGNEYVNGTVTIGDKTYPLMDVSRTDDGRGGEYLCLYYWVNKPEHDIITIIIENSGDIATIQTFEGCYGDDIIDPTEPGHKHRWLVGPAKDSDEFKRVMISMHHAVDESSDSNSEENSSSDNS